MRERERERELDNKTIVFNWLERGVFGLLSLCHLNNTHMQVTCFIFPSNLTVKLTSVCKV